MADNILENVWPEWQIVRQIGKGSFGVVYEAVRTDHSIESHAAIKVISIPQNESEIESLRSEGLSEDATRRYLQGVVDEFVDEIRLMESFKGIQNIVSVEDYKVVEKTDELGWNIYIRMELLTPFNSSIRDKTLSEMDVIRLGVDICSALELCARRNVIHRDIKPENIFVNQFGDFKLGDFGIARKLENVTGGLSRKGTYNYMAPEIERGRQYDATVDLYSLGLVLYRFMNRNRLPFLDTERQCLNPNERMAAIRRRMDGEPLPAPCDASPAMAQIILCACAPDPGRRFACASAMKTALTSVLNSTYSERRDIPDLTPPVIQAPPAKDSDETILIPAPHPPRKSIDTFGGRKKSRAPAIISAVLAAALLVGGGIYAVSRFSDGKTSTKEDNPAVSDPVSSESGSAEHSYQYITDNCSWTEAFEKAKAAGGYLARFDTMEEYLQILSEIEAEGLTQIEFRIGARRAHNGEDYFWVDENNAMFGDRINSDDHWTRSEWLSGEPSYQWKTNSEEYLEIYFDQKTGKWVWNDVADAVYRPEENKYGYIVEFDS